MSTDLLLSAAASIAAFVYLLFVLWQPERF
jgi:K+-transporting ATPase KdpF subunit